MSCGQVGGCKNKFNLNYCVYNHSTRLTFLSTINMLSFSIMRYRLHESLQMNNAQRKRVVECSHFQGEPWICLHCITSMKLRLNCFKCQERVYKTFSTNVVSCILFPFQQAPPNLGLFMGSREGIASRIQLVVEVPIPNQDPIDNLQGIRISISLGLNIGNEWL